MRRSRTILDSPEAQSITQVASQGLSGNARGTEAPVIRDSLSHHLENLVTLANSIAQVCTEAGEGLAEAHLEDEVCDRTTIIYCNLQDYGFGGNLGDNPRPEKPAGDAQNTVLADL